MLQVPIQLVFISFIVYVRSHTTGSVGVMLTLLLSDHTQVHCTITVLQANTAQKLARSSANSQKLVPHMNFVGNTLFKFGSAATKSRLTTNYNLTMNSIPDFLRKIAYIVKFPIQSCPLLIQTKHVTRIPSPNNYSFLHAKEAQRQIQKQTRIHTQVYHTNFINFNS